MQGLLPFPSPPAIRKAVVIDIRETIQAPKRTGSPAHFSYDELARKLLNLYTTWIDQRADDRKRINRKQKRMVHIGEVGE